jgi:pimeloyl-ACP methyl ester carboxylesterase
MLLRTTLPILACLAAAPVTAEVIAAESPVGPLSGTLERPQGDTLATALILPGSGPTDRDGNNAMGLASDAYRLLAEGLAAEGIATARIDKRGIGDSAGGPGMEVSLAAYRADTEAWIASLREATGADCVWLIGHSEGGVLAIDAAELDHVCGLVLLATAGRPIGALIRDQVARQPGTEALLPALDAALEALMAGGRPDPATIPPPLAPLFGEDSLDYLRELALLDPAEALGDTDLPTLIVHGSADIQVAASEGDTLATARDDAARTVLPGMTHTLKQVADEADLSANMATYTDPGLPLHDGLVPVVSNFILGRDG